jgi:hypothetical protein
VKLANRAVQVMIAAMLTLAVSLMWPSTGSVASSSHAHVHGIENDVSRDHSAHHDRRLDGAIQIDCEPSAIGCCMMTLCHPALAIEPNHMAFMGGGGRPEPAMAARVFGSKPDVVDPPPRIPAV